MINREEMIFAFAFAFSMIGIVMAEKFGGIVEIPYLLMAASFLGIIHGGQARKIDELKSKDTVVLEGETDE
ncbi:unnamed protein product [marine sediment metagenome]|uniref:Uncharacterized protein n=1 Tax=marine sediment metagenome TaxID=412755 RepID=X0RLC5_9ZZZZ